VAKVQWSSLIIIKNNNKLIKVKLSDKSDNGEGGGGDRSGRMIKADCVYISKTDMFSQKEK
jgi:hypothetical protein